MTKFQFGNKYWLMSYTYHNRKTHGNINKQPIDMKNSSCLLKIKNEN